MTAPTAGTGTIHLLRHAKADPRKGFRADDRLRSLTEEGERQAVAVAARLSAGRPRVDRILSSAALRCLGTVTPLATALALPVRTVDHLMEGSDPLDTLGELLSGMGGGGLVACTHGDVVLGIVEAIAPKLGLGSALAAPKASTWELSVRAGEVEAARLVPPPALS